MRFAAYVALTLASVAFAVPVKRSAADIESAITSLATQTTALDTAINAFPNTGGSLLAALSIHSSAQSLVTSLNSLTTTVQGTAALSETDGGAIISSIEALTPTIGDALTQIVSKKASFAALPVSGIPALVLQDLQSLETGLSTFGTALITILPADLQTTATTLDAEIATGFAPAIAAYSS